MSIGIMPVTGIPLPFFSYGGSSMITNMLGIGLVEGVYLRHKRAACIVKMKSISMECVFKNIPEEHKGIINE